MLFYVNVFDVVSSAKNGAQYIVETKLGVEAKLLDAMMKLNEYSKFVTEAKGAFAVLFLSR